MSTTARTKPSPPSSEPLVPPGRTPARWPAGSPRWPRGWTAGCPSSCRRATERPEAVHEAMAYALTGPGKRVRPVLTLMVAELFGERSAPVLDLACSIEMVHACSLILDDLPSMDDASLRRGRPTVHRVYRRGRGAARRPRAAQPRLRPGGGGRPPDLAAPLHRRGHGPPPGRGHRQRRADRRPGARSPGPARGDEPGPPGVHPQPQDRRPVHGRRRAGRHGGRRPPPRPGGRRPLRQEPGPRLPDRRRPAGRPRHARGDRQGHGQGRPAR